MSTLLQSISTPGQSVFIHPTALPIATARYGAAKLFTRMFIFALVIAAHVALVTVWSTQPNTQAATRNEMSISFAMADHATQAVAPQPLKSSEVMQPVVEKVADQAPIMPVQQTVPPAAPSMAAVAPAVADTEPDYKAMYLNNPPPAYPMVARRNGLQGRVVLNVEVLADGVCGQINIQKSSGYSMLDNAALQRVKSWRFVPARQRGHAVDKWFIIPVQFSLKDNAA